MADTFTVTAHRIAQSEGWCLSERDDGFYELQRLDDSAIFDTDKAAVAYVTTRARQGSAVHQRALRLDGQKVKP